MKKENAVINFLTNRIVESWNKLSIKAISARTVDSFKALFDKKIFKLIS